MLKLSQICKKRIESSNILQDTKVISEVKLTYGMGLWGYKYTL